MMTTDETPTGPGVPGRLLRVTAAALVSLAVWMGVVFVTVRLRPSGGEGFQDLGDFIVILFFGLVAASLSVWPLLRLLKAQAAGLAALAGPFLSIGVGAAVAGRETLATPWLGIAVVAGGYLLAGLVTEGRLPVWPRVAVVAALIAAIAAGFALR